MKLVVQPALEGSVTVEGEVVGKIGKGAVCLVGIHRDDKEEDLDWGVQKLLSFCLFDGDDAPFSKTIKDIDGELLLVTRLVRAAELHERVPPLARNHAVTVA